MVGLVVQVHRGLLLGVPEVGLLDEAGHVELGGVCDLLGHQGLLGHELTLQLLDAGDQVPDDLGLVDMLLQVPVVALQVDFSISGLPVADRLPLGDLALLPSI